MPTMDELEFGDEVRGRVCPECGSSVVHRGHGVWCDWCDEYVNPVREATLDVLGGGWNEH